MADDADRRSQEIGNAVDTLETQIREQIARTRSGTTAILVIGLILIVIVFAVLTSLTSRLKEAFEPEYLAEAAVGLAAERVPLVVEALEAEMKKDPQERVGKLKTAILDGIPRLRREADRKFAALIDDLAQQLDEKIDQAVGETLETLKPEVEPLIEAAKAKGNWEPLAEAFEKGLDDLISAKADEVTVEFDRSMTELDMHLDRLLKDEKDMTDAEKFQKNIVTAMLVFMCDVLDTVVKEQVQPPTR